MTTSGEDRAKQGEAKEPARPTCKYCETEAAWWGVNARAWLCQECAKGMNAAGPFVDRMVQEKTNARQSAIKVPACATCDGSLRIVHRDRMRARHGETEPCPTCNGTRESRAATRAGEADDETHRVNWVEWTKLQARVVEAEQERDHWKAKAEQPAVPTLPVNEAASREMDEYMEQKRKPSAAGADEVIERVARALGDYDGNVMSHERYRRQAMVAIAALRR